MLFVVIQARVGSTRLRGKVLKELCGMSVLEVIFKRLEIFRENIIVATTDDGSEKPIVEICEKNGIRYFRGSCENVLSRFYDALEANSAQSGDVVVRITSDCPLIDPKILSECIERFENEGYDYLSNVEKRTFPRGLDVEVMSFDVLEEAYNYADTKIEKEHVTPYIRITNRDMYKIGSLRREENNSKYRLTIDEESDLEAIVEIYKKLNCRFDFSYEELIAILKNNPYIYDLNSKVVQKSV